VLHTKVADSRTLARLTTRPHVRIYSNSISIAFTVHTILTML
jgi:hypothetical protein